MSNEKKSLFTKMEEQDEEGNVNRTELVNIANFVEKVKDRYNYADKEENQIEKKCEKIRNIMVPEVTNIK
jgi:hypothetical protein